MHIGVGNFHRAHQAWYLHKLMQQGLAQDWALIGAGVRAYDSAMRDKLQAQDYLTTLIELAPGRVTAEVVGSMIDYTPIAEDNAPLIAAMADHIARTMTYGSDRDNAHTNAEQSYAARKGVCRDYAHIMISMARAANIPARFASTYAPDVQPQDFHAVPEVFLDGRWHLIDPTGMAQASEMAVIGIGRDATDVSFLTAFGSMNMVEQRVNVRRV